jgi:hypothetical protein
MSSRMSRNGVMRATKLLGAALLAALLSSATGSGVIAVAAPAEAPTEVVARESAENESLAREEVQERLASLQLPAGAVAVDEFAGRFAREMELEGGDPAGAREVLETGFWRVPRSPRQIFASLRRRPPPGMRFETGSINSGQASIGFAPRQLPAGIDAASVGVTAARRGDVSWVRVEVWVQWELPRSPAARIPGRPRFVEISIWPTSKGSIPFAPGEPQPPPRVPRFNSTARPGVVADIVGTLEGLPAVQPLGYPKCGPPDIGPTSRIELVFRDRRGGKALARASQRTPPGWCAPFVLRPAGGEESYPLESDDGVLEPLRALMQTARPRGHA